MAAAATYRRIAADIRRRIAAGEWAAGEALPSRVFMARQYGVHEQTIRLAYVELRRTGVLEGEKRRGVYVAHPPAMRTLTDADADWPWASETTDTRGRPATPDLAARLQVAPAARLHHEMIECMDPGGRSAMVVRSWWQGQRRPHLTYTAELGVMELDEAVAHALGLLVDTVAYRVIRTRLDGEGVPTETADLYLPMDRWTVRIAPPVQ